MTSPFSLHGRAALVTGASRGIGAAIAAGLAAAGADVALCARSIDSLEAVAGRISSDTGRRALPIRCEVTDPEDVAACVDQAWRLLDGLDVLVTAAGGPLFHSPIADVRQTGWARVLELNLTSVLCFAQACGERMAARGTGCLITIGSVPPTRAWPAIASYTAAKAGVLSLTMSFAAEWGPRGVRANAICPGWVRTATNEAYLGDPETEAMVVDAVPLRRWADPEEVAGTAVWLASDAARYVTGAVIPVDGGLSIGLSEAWQDQMAAALHRRSSPDLR